MTAAQLVEYRCPECQKVGVTKTYFRAQDLGRHRRFTHGVLGKYARENQLAKAKRGVREDGKHADVFATAGAASDVIRPDIQANERAFEREVAYCFGRLEAQLEAYAHSVQLPVEVLTGAVAELLLRTSGRKGVGAKRGLSSL